MSTTQTCSPAEQGDGSGGFGLNAVGVPRADGGAIKDSWAKRLPGRQLPLSSRASHALLPTMFSSPGGG